MTAPFLPKQVEPNFKSNPADAPPKKPRAKKRGGMYGTGWKGKATKAHAELVRARGRCEGCGSTQNLQCCHIIGRGVNATRTDEDNALCGCASCHAVWGVYPLQFAGFCRAYLGDEHLERIHAKAAAGRGKKYPESFWRGEYERLAAKLKEIEG